MVKEQTNEQINKIKENNHLIATFLGFTIKKGAWEESFTGWYIPIKDFVDKEYVHPDHLQFHTSWDWLMPVLDKIEKMGHQTVASQMDFGGEKHHYINIMTNVDFIKATPDNPYKLGGQAFSKFAAYYEGIIEFIKWYNRKN